MGAVSPGPDFIMIVRNSTGFGSKIGFKTALGISIGCLITLSYILVGVGAVFNQFPILKCKRHLAFFQHSINNDEFLN